MMTPEQRRARAPIAAHTVHARGRTNVQPAREAAEARFARQVIDEAEQRGEALTDAEIAKRAGHVRAAFYLRLSMASAKARSGRARQRRAAPAIGTPGAASEARDGARDPAG
jgi:hypothetical protein